MTLLALRKRRLAAGQAHGPTEMLLPLGMGLLSAAMGGVMGAKMPGMSALTGLAALGAGAWQDSPMLQMAGATMLAGVAADATNFFQDYNNREARRTEPATHKEKFKAYADYLKAGLPFAKKPEQPPEEQSEELAGIGEEFAALDRIEARLNRAAPQDPPRLF